MPLRGCHESRRTIRGFAHENDCFRCPRASLVVQRCLDLVLIEFRDRKVFAVDHEVLPALLSFGDANVHSLCHAIRIGSRLVVLNPVLFVRKTTGCEALATLLKFTPRHFPCLEWSHYPSSVLVSSSLCQSPLFGRPSGLRECVLGGLQGLPFRACLWCRHDGICACFTDRTHAFPFVPVRHECHHRNSAVAPLTMFLTAFASLDRFALTRPRVRTRTGCSMPTMALVCVLFQMGVSFDPAGCPTPLSAGRASSTPSRPSVFSGTIMSRRACSGPRATRGPRSCGHARSRPSALCSAPSGRCCGRPSRRVTRPIVWCRLQGVSTVLIDLHTVRVWSEPEL